MKIKELQFNDASRESLYKGITVLSDAVKATLGPKGRNVVIEQTYGAPRITKDGVSVAKEIELENRFENLGAQLLKSVASKTNDIAGDGTTTATVLGYAIIKEGLKAISAGYKPMGIKKGIESAVAHVKEELEKRSKKISSKEEISQVGTISANGEKEIGDILAEAMSKVGEYGVITVEEAKSLETEMEVVEGMQFNKGMVSPYFSSNVDKMTCELDKPYILATDKRIDSVQCLLPLLEGIIKTGRPLMVICQDIDNSVIGTLVLNKIKNGLKICVAKAPSFGDNRKAILEDIAILTGGTMIADGSGMTLEKTTVEQLGQCDKIRVDKENTVIIGGNGTEVESRCNLLKNQIAESKSDFEKEKLQERLAKLLGGVAIIRVGGATEVEVKERKDRVDDALHATRAAVEEGIVPGGGTALLYASENLILVIENSTEDFRVGVDIVRKALKEPFRQILINAGLEDTYLLKVLLAKNDNALGYNVSSDNTDIINLVENGIIDPTKVVRTALENAASVASLVLTTQVTIITKPSDTPADIENMSI